MSSLLPYTHTPPLPLPPVPCLFFAFFCAAKQTNKTIALLLPPTWPRQRVAHLTPLCLTREHPMSATPSPFSSPSRAMAYHLHLKAQLSSARARVPHLAIHEADPVTGQSQKGEGGRES